MCSIIKLFLMVLVVCLFSNEISYGQQTKLSGYVYDDQSNEPIVGLDVRLQNVEFAAITNNKGYYEFLLEDSLEVVNFQYFSGKKISKEEKLSDGSYNLYLSSLNYTELLSMSLSELIKVKVDIVSKIKEPLEVATGVVTVINAREIEQFGGSSLRDILERVTGTVGLTGYTNRNVISLRGDQLQSGSQHILILINGRPTREIINGGYDSDIYAMFPVNQIERVEIIRGPGSVLYGSSAFTGVINVVIKTSSEYLDVSTQLGLDKESIMAISGVKTIKEGTISGGIYLRDMGLWKQSFTTELEVDTSFSTPDKGMSMNLAYSAKDWVINTHLITWETFLIAPRFGGSNSTSIRNFVDFGYNHAFSERIKATVNVTNTYSKREGFPFHPRIKSNDFITEFTTYFKASPKYDILVGSLINYLSGVSEREISGEIVPSMTFYKQYRASLYAQMNYSFKDNIRLTGGFQVHKYNESNQAIFVPRLGMTWHPRTEFFLKALYAKAFRNPSGTETSLNDPRLEGNPDLVPEYTNAYDLQFIYNTEKTQSSVTFYINSQENIIVRDYQEAPQSFVNKGSFLMYGIELETKFMPIQKLFCTGSTTYQQNILDNTISNSTTSPVTAKLGVSYLFDFGITMSMFNIYNSKPPDVVNHNLNRLIVNPIPNSFNLFSFKTEFNLSDHLKHVDFDFRFNLTIENLFDENIYNAEWGRGIINSIPGNSGRRFLLGLRMKM